MPGAASSVYRHISQLHTFCLRRYLQVSQIGFQFQLNPGDVVFMKSSLLYHSVSPITSGNRIGVVFFTHELMQD